MRLEAVTSSPQAALRPDAAVVDTKALFWNSRWFLSARTLLVVLLLAAPLAFGAVPPVASAALVGLIVLAMSRRTQQYVEEVWRKAA